MKARCCALLAGAIVLGHTVVAQAQVSDVGIVVAVQGFAAQVSSNIRGAIVGRGAIAEAKSNQETQREIQADRVAAIKAHQFSTPFCQDATGANIAIALAANATTDQILTSRANAHRTAGYKRPESSNLPSVAGLAAFQERKSNFCDPNDPACHGIVGKRPEGDRMPGAVFAISRLDTDDDRNQAAWVINNLTMPLPPPAMTDRQISQTGGQAAYMRRGGNETQINLAKDAVTDILWNRRLPKADPKYYNGLAAEAGLPQASGNVSQEDMDRMRYRDRFSDKFSTKIAALGDPTVLTREVIALQADEISLGYRTNQLLEQKQLLWAAVLAALQEGRIEAAAGDLR